MGQGEGGPPAVRVYDPVNAAVPLTFQAYGSGFSGGVRVAVGDVNGDGQPDIVTGAGAGAQGHVKVFSGMDGGPLLASFFAYGTSFSGGVFVASGDVNGDGFDDIVTGTDAGAGPHVKVFSGQSGAELASFFAFTPSFTGGVRVAAGDLNGDGYADVIVGAGPGGGPQVTAYAGGSSGVGGVLHSFFAYSPSFTGGVFVAAGDLNGDGRDDIVTGAGTGSAGGHVRVFSGVSLGELASFLAFSPSFTGGARVAVADVVGSSAPEIIAGSGPGMPPQVGLFSPGGGLITAFAAGTGAGIYVAGADAGACYPDCNDDGVLTIADFACFQAKFVGGSPYADCNGSGTLTIADFACYQSKFVGGCP